MAAMLVAAPFLLGSALIAAALSLAPPLLSVRATVSPADAIVVLGGDAAPRAAFALKLYKAGLAPRIVVSGAGDCAVSLQILAKGGVPPERISLDCSSLTTMENATASAALLNKAGARSAILVTHWYHGRRALACFRKAAPGLDVKSMPVPEIDPIATLAWTRDRDSVLKEYVKIAWYAVRYGLLSPGLASGEQP